MCSECQECSFALEGPAEAQTLADEEGGPAENARIRMPCCKGQSCKREMPQIVHSLPQMKA